MTGDQAEQRPSLEGRLPLLSVSYNRSLVIRQLVDPWFVGPRGDTALDMRGDLVHPGKPDITLGHHVFDQLRNLMPA